MELVSGYVIPFFRSVLAFGLIVGFIAFIHELGHYTLAKLMGVRVDEFSLGFGKLLWGRRIGETDYSLRILPFIAYVRPAGMDSEEEYEPGDEPGERSFQAKGFWAKQLILVGGPVFNFLGTIAILTGMYWLLGQPPTTIHVGSLLEGRPAAAAGIRPGDVFTHLDDQQINDRDEAIDYIKARAGEPIRVRLKRPLDPGGEVDLEDESRWKKMALEVVPADVDGRGLIGIEARPLIVGDDRVRFGFFDALGKASSRTMDYVGRIYRMTIGVIIQAFGSMEVPREVGGPVKIIAVISRESQSGIESLLLLTAGLSLSIGVFNLLPIPALDGGRMLLLLLTWLAAATGRLIGRQDLAEGTVARRIEEGLHLLGFLFLILLMLVITWKDIKELIWGTAPATPAPTEAPRQPGSDDSSPASGPATGPAGGP